MPIVVLVATAFACLAIAEAIYYAVRYSGERKRAELRRRMRAGRESGTTNLLREERIAKSRELSRMLQALPYTAEAAALLAQTSLPWTVARLYGIGIVCAAALATLGMSFLGQSPALPWLLGVIGFALPVVAAMISRTRRSSDISTQLPEALDMMVRSLRAGHGLSAAFKLVATEMPAPISVEFARAFEEINMGIEFRDAINNMTDRVPGNLDLKIFAVSVVLQHETGGNLVEILDQISQTIRERYKFYGKLEAMTSEAKMSGIILGSMPPLALAFMAVTNGAYLSVLGTDPAGAYVILIGLSSWVAGLVWLFRLANVEY